VIRAIAIAAVLASCSTTAAVTPDARDDLHDVVTPCAWPWGTGTRTWPNGCERACVSPPADTGIAACAECDPHGPVLFPANAIQCSAYATIEGVTGCCYIPDFPMMETVKFCECPR
jgi:hypothetical protein